MEIRINAEVHLHLHDQPHHRPRWVDEIIEAIAVLADNEEDKAKMRALSQDLRAHAEALAGAIPPTTP